MRLHTLLYFRPFEYWTDAADKPFQPGNDYYIGENSKFYAAVLKRFRWQDFAPIADEKAILQVQNKLASQG